ncbi:NmrA family NAD(P)-binding protein [Stigmatella hybrida]|uniref:NmrA family NAD(P)-binding protein n=1 Tax=Stigmatella hybrida TaxID=394097 RepID=UPI001CDA5A98
MADLAVEAGVQHLVDSSTNMAGPQKTCVGHFDSKSQIEAHVRSLPITHTIIRPDAFMEPQGGPSPISAFLTACSMPIPSSPA